MGQIVIKVEGGISAGGGGIGVLDSIDKTLLRMEQALARMQRNAEIGIRTNQQTLTLYREQEKSVTNIYNVTNNWVNASKTLNVQQNAFHQTQVAVANTATHINNTTNQIAAATKRAKDEAAGWERTLRGVAGGLASFNRNADFSRAPFSGGIRTLGRIGEESFGGAFGGGGVAGILASPIRLAAGTVEFAAKTGGELANAVGTGFARTMGLLGSGLSQTVLGAIVGIPLQLAGAAGGIVGGMGGAALSAAGGLVGKVGELGGAVAEKLLGSIAKGLTVGAVGAAALGTTAISSALDREPVAAAFASKTAGIGGQAQVLRELRSATRDTVADTELMTTANRAMQLGAAKSREELVYLAQAARILGTAVGRDTTESFNRLAVGIGKMEGELLDELGLVVRATEANRAWAAMLGKSSDELSAQERQAAFAAVALGQIAIKLRDVNEISDTTNEKWQQAKTLFGNTVTSLGTVLLPALATGLDRLNPLVRATRDWIEEHESGLGERAVAGVKRFADAIGVVYDWSEKIVAKVREKGLVTAWRETLDETRDLWGPWVEYAKKKINEVADYAEARFNRLKAQAKMQSMEATAEVLAFVATAGTMNATQFEQMTMREEKSKRTSALGQAYGSGLGWGESMLGDQFSSRRPNYGKSFHPSPFGNDEVEQFRGMGLIRDRFAGGVGSGQVPMLTPQDMQYLGAIQRFRGALDELAKDLERRGEQLDKDLGDAGRRFESTMDKMSEVAARQAELEVRDRERREAIQARLIERESKINLDRGQRLRALPGQIADDFSSDADMPGVSLRARSALLRARTLERREKAAEINRLFGSRSFDDPFGGASVDDSRLQMRGSSIRGATIDPFGGGPGRSETASGARDALLRAVQQSATYQQQAAAVNAAADAAVVEAQKEATAAQAERDREHLRAFAELKDKFEEQVQNSREALSVFQGLRDELRSVTRQLDEVKRQIRSVK